jgi:hypothetical protein
VTSFHLYNSGPEVTMVTKWQEAFRNRMRHFEASRPRRPGEVAVSIKIRVESGCFHREHSPKAYALIDERLDKLSTRGLWSFEEHESGPELLVYVVSALGLAVGIVNLITAIINARSAGIKKGDHPDDPLLLIVRRTEDRDGLREEFVLRIAHTDKLAKNALAQALTTALQKLLRDRKS